MSAQASDFVSSLFGASTEALVAQIKSSFGYSVKLSAEWEFLLADLQNLPHADMFWSALLDITQAQNTPIASIAEEPVTSPYWRQFEIRLDYTEVGRALHIIQQAQQAVIALAARFELPFSMAAFADGLSSGLHWHVHLESAEGGFVFTKANEVLSPALEQSLGGLLATINPLMRCFAATDAARTRLLSKSDHVPRTLSWGGNNRSVALRLPESVIAFRHIEHRVCGADAPLVAACWALMVGLHYGLTANPPIPPQCFGDANRTAELLPIACDEAAISAALDAAMPWLQPYLNPEIEAYLRGAF